VDEIEEVFIAINKEVYIDIKQEGIAGAITFPKIKTEPDELSYVCMYIIRHDLNVSRIVFFYVIMCV
jgi:hypothetical protein